MNARMRLVGLMGGLTCLLVIGCAASDSNSPERDSQIRPGSSSGEKGNGALPEKEPEILPQTHLAAGQLHETQGHLARAAEQYRLAIAAEPRLVSGYNRLGVVLDRLGRFKEADETFLKAIQLAPDQAYLHNNLGFSYTMQSRWTEAGVAFRKALELNPAFSRARINLAMVLAQQDRFEEARDQFLLALTKADAYYNLGLMYQSKQRLREAAAAYKTALESKPEMVAARNRLNMIPEEIVRSADTAVVQQASPARATDQGTVQAPMKTTPQPVDAGDAAGEIDVAPAQEGNALSMARESAQPGSHEGETEAADLSPLLGSVGEDQPVQALVAISNEGNGFAHNQLELVAEDAPVSDAPSTRPADEAGPATQPAASSAVPISSSLELATQSPGETNCHAPCMEAYLLPGLLPLLPTPPAVDVSGSSRSGVPQTQPSQAWRMDPEQVRRMLSSLAQPLRRSLGPPERSQIGASNVNSPQAPTSIYAQPTDWRIRPTLSPTP